VLSLRVHLVAQSLKPGLNCFGLLAVLPVLTAEFPKKELRLDLRLIKMAGTFSIELVEANMNSVHGNQPETGLKK